MKASDINTLKQAQRYVEGCINDFEAGISTKDETIKYLGEYTLRLMEIFSKTPDTCEHEEVMKQGDGFTYSTCSKCGAELNE